MLLLIVLAPDRARRRLATDQPLQMLRVPGSLHCDLGNGAIDLAQIVRRQFDGGRSDILLARVRIEIEAEFGCDDDLLAKGCKSFSPMQPSPMAETSKLLFPSLRFCIFEILSLSSRSESSHALQTQYCASLTFSIQLTALPFRVS
jgi:hypothetical protein